MEQTTLEQMTYEQKVEKLRQIVSRLENEELGLDESIALFEEGTKLAAECNKALNDAEQKFKILGGEEA